MAFLLPKFRAIISGQLNHTNTSFLPFTDDCSPTMGLLQWYLSEYTGREIQCRYRAPRFATTIQGIVSKLCNGLRVLIFASLVAQLVKNPPAMRETWVQPLSWEDPLEKGKATHSSILAWRVP